MKYSMASLNLPVTELNNEFSPSARHLHIIQHFQGRTYWYPASMLSSVVFPAPDGPMIAVIPGWKSPLTPNRICFSSGMKSMNGNDFLDATIGSRLFSGASKHCSGLNHFFRSFATPDQSCYPVLQPGNPFGCLDSFGNPRVDDIASLERSTCFSHSSVRREC